MRRPLVIFDFATAPIWISLYMWRKFDLKKEDRGVCFSWVGRRAVGWGERRSSHRRILMQRRYSYRRILMQRRYSHRRILVQRATILCRRFAARLRAVPFLVSANLRKMLVKLQISFSSFKIFYRFFIFMYDIQHCFICRPSFSTVFGGCWDWTQDSCDYDTGCQTL